MESISKDSTLDVEIEMINGIKDKLLKEFKIQATDNNTLFDDDYNYIGGKF